MHDPRTDGNYARAWQEAVAEIDRLRAAYNDDVEERQRWQEKCDQLEAELRFAAGAVSTMPQFRLMHPEEVLEWLQVFLKPRARRREGKMANKERKGWRYLYECDECHARRFVSWVEANRAAKPRCRQCGCTRLELVSEDAREDQARLNRERIAGTGGSLRLASQCENTHRAVR